MQEKLAHRGPDDCGIFVSTDQRCTLAHTRLSILDLSPAGHQPMGWGEGDCGFRIADFGFGNDSPQRSEVSGFRSPVVGPPSYGARYWIVFNGEIYNYRELREELGARSREQRAGSEATRRAGGREQGEFRNSDFGLRNLDSVNPTQETLQTQQTRNTAPWRSNTDTEVILRAYAKWGRECVNHLRGMFAFAIWDEQKQELFLARDPFGIKPLYYYQTDSVFLFASEVRALLASGLVPRKLSKDGLASYLQFGSAQDPMTIIDGVRSLLPGHCLVVTLEDRRLETDIFRYANDVPHQADDGVPATRMEAVEILRAKLEESIRVHLISDVPLGAFLSGGIDSSAIVALMSRVAHQKPKTYSVIFKEAEFSEAEHAKVIAQQFGTEHKEILLSEESLFGLLPRALEAMDQPTMDGINTYVVSKAVKESGVTVALSGLGGDELFAGYPSFRRAMQLHRLATAPFAIRQFASTAGRAFLNGSARRGKFWDMVESDCTPYAAYELSRRLFAPDEIACLVRDAVRREALGVRRTDTTNAIDSINAMNNSQFAIRNPQSEIESDVVNAVSRYELEGYMVNTLLRDTDQMSMAHALEVRVPFVDQEIVNYVTSLPGKWKIEGGRPKPLLVDAVGELLPEEIWRRPKMGFTLPFQRWMKTALESEVNAALFCSDLSSIGINSDSARGIWEAFKDNPRQEPWSRPWALYVLKKWCDLNGVTAS